MIQSHISNWNVKNKRVFIRADLNVPLINGAVANDFRLRSSTKTIDYIINNGGSVILATHIGRPIGHDPNLSTQLLLPWFTERGYDIHYCAEIEKAAQAMIKPGQIILLENLRFFTGETKSDPFFAKQLAQTAQYYINDAFGSIHRYDSSIAVLPYEFTESRRSIGFLVEKELKMCDSLLSSPKRPFVAIIGGGKVADKLPLIQEIIKTTDILLLCPAICFSFLKALDMPVGTSLIDESSIELCKKIMENAHNHEIDIIFPIDYQISQDETFQHLSYVTGDNFPSNGFGVSIGPKTIDRFKKEIEHAGTIFFNGTMGFVDHPKTVEGTNAILHAMAHASGVTIVAGGDTAQAACNAGIEDKITYLSTGGGATLAYISNPLLPGLLPFEEV